MKAAHRLRGYNFRHNRLGQVVVQAQYTAGTVHEMPPAASMQ